MAKIIIKQPKVQKLNIRGVGGIKGATGDAATVTVGNTTTTEPGTSAVVTNTGDEHHAVLDFAIPRGERGLQGEQGVQGEPGIQGEPGVPGEKGDTGTIRVGTVTTGEPGTPASVTNVGTDTDAVFNFTIPKGAKGEAGEGTGDMLKADYDSDNTVANAGGIKNYLSSYVKKTDYATSSKAGVIKGAYTFQIDNAGTPYGRTISYNDYAGATTSAFVSKGTLENVLNGRKYLMPEYTQTLPQTGAENKLYLVPTAEQPDVLKQTEGKEITLTDASEGNLEWGEIKGETSQQSTSGKNLLYVPSTPTSHTNNIEMVSSDTNSLVLRSIGTPGSYDSYKYEYTLEQLGLVAGQTYTLSCTLTTDNPNASIRIAKDASSGGSDIINRLTPTNNPVTFTVPAGSTKIGFFYYIDHGHVPTVGQVSKFENIQLEKGSSATTFEPYTAGASPNPTYPQEVKTVTGKNEIVVSGKNLFNGDSYQWSKNYLTADGTWGSNSSIMTDTYIEVLPNTEYIISWSNGTLTDSIGWSGFPMYNQYRADKSVIGRDLNRGNRDSNKYVSFRTEPDCKYVRFAFYTMTKSGSQVSVDLANHTYADYITNIQLELGSTATTYEPYRKQSVEVNLGDIELCKIGTHQDRIYKDSEGWKLHKEVGKDTIGGKTWEDASSISAFFTFDTHYGSRPDTTQVYAISEAFRGISRSSAGASTDNYMCINADGYLIIRHSESSSPSEFKTWADANNSSYYYVLNTPTDTLITNSALIEQLDNLNTLSTGQGYNLISTDTEHEAPTLKFEYYHPDPTVTKDEYIWVENHYEKIGLHEWGKITGDIEHQQDLKHALDAKADKTEIPVVPSLDNYVKNTDYATGATGGVVKVGDAYGVSINTQSGNIYPISQSYAQYQGASNYSFVGKGTLNNVIAGKQLVSQSDISDVIRTTDEGVIRDTNIADGAVTVSKLDASTIDYSVGNPTSGDSITLTQSWQAIIQSGTLPAGTYLVFCEWYYNVTSLSGDMNDVHVTIATSAANAATTQLTNEGIYNGWNHGARTCIRRVVLDSDNKIGLYMKRATTTGTVITTANRCSLNIIRVA